ncbi:MAG TPA: SpoIID/LytB domain-containing protein [Pyrinomonadaceae bacterium]|nr:SpoIID/LytB domain-containing protein [Pyrinomonadaceae bacterium]
MPNASSAAARRLSVWILCVAFVLTVWVIAEELTVEQTNSSSSNALTEDAMDRNLQRAATIALGDKRGTIIVMDPQTGRVRAVVNPKMAFEENLPPGSTIKPFTILAALRSGVVDEDSRTGCREDYALDDFHTVCSHPRGLAPLNPTDAIAYSCNYYFGRLGERLNETSFVSTLNEFGFGKKTGINAENESAGKLLRNGWRSRDAIGEGDNVLATPIQMINAYAALANGGHLQTPRLSTTDGFVAKRQSELTIDEHQRLMIVKGMRGAVRYGTAETAGLYKLPNYIFGKTGTATQLNGFRSQGWFIGFASAPDGGSDDSQTAPERVRLAVLVFLSKAHGSDAAEVARPIFEEFSVSGTPNNSSPFLSSPDKSLSESVRVHLIGQEVTESIPLEDYVRGVVATEGSTENQLEALKALAIAVRTYAVRNMGRHQKDGYDFCSMTHCQRYQSVSSSRATSLPSAVIEAVAATRGQVLEDSDGQIADSYFSASCGGATANIGTLWGGPTPAYLRGVNDEACDTELHNSWTDIISEAQLSKALQSDPRTNVGARLASVHVVRRDQSDRAELISIKGTRNATVKGWEFKIIVGRSLGWNLLKSSRFEIARSGSNFIFRGKGFGHGLGLCQEGAHVMASHGFSHREILEKYFPTTHVMSNRNAKGAADLFWSPIDPSGFAPRLNYAKRPGRISRQILKSEGFRIDYPDTIDRREIESLLGLLHTNRNALVSRVAVAGLNPRIPTLEVFINDTTGNFVGRTGQPPWAAAATRNNRIELQPLGTLKKRGVLETTVKHELVHILVDALGGSRAPRWLAEGLAINFSGEGPMVSRYQPRQTMTIQEIEQNLSGTPSANEMKASYAAAYNEVRRLIKDEGEANVWRRVVR